MLMHIKRTELGSMLIQTHRKEHFLKILHTHRTEKFNMLLHNYRKNRAWCSCTPTYEYRACRALHPSGNKKCWQLLHTQRIEQDLQFLHKHNRNFRTSTASEHKRADIFWAFTKESRADSSPFKVRSCHYVLTCKAIWSARSSKDADISGTIQAKTVK